MTAIVRKSQPIVLGIASDIHAGGTTAACPPEVMLDDGGSYHFSKTQAWLFQCLGDFWNRVSAVRDQSGARLFAVLNGDLVEGHHHRTSQVLSSNPIAQRRVNAACMQLMLDTNPEKLLVVRGTDAHAGESAHSEEAIAEGLAEKWPVVRDPDTGSFSWRHLKMELQGVRLDIGHHGRAGFREHTRMNAVAMYAHDIILAHVKRGEPWPHLCVRAHHHRFADSSNAAPTRVLTSGAFQFKTGFGYKIALDTLTDIGGYIIVIERGEYEVIPVQFTPEPQTIWRPTDEEPAA